MIPLRGWEVGEQGRKYTAFCSGMLGNLAWYGDLIHRYFCEYFIGLFTVLSLAYITIYFIIFYFFFTHTVPDINHSKTSLHQTAFPSTQMVISSCFGITKFPTDLPRDLWIHLHLDSSLP